jgi:tol-pal system protein YbgF
MDKTGDVTSQHGIKKLLAKNQYSEAMTAYKALVKISGEMHPKILSMIKNAKSIQTADTTKTEPSFLFIRPKIANFREEPSLSSNKIGQLKQNTKVEKLSTEGEWFEIKIKNEIGWLHESVISKLPYEKRDKDELSRPVVSNWKSELERRKKKDLVLNKEKGEPKEVKKGYDEEGINTRRSFSTRTASVQPAKMADSTLEVEYVKAVQEIVKENWSFPVVGETLKASVAFKVERDGKATDIWFKKKSKNRQFNESVLHTLKKTVFPTPPDKILDEVFVITFHSTMSPTKVASSPSHKTDGFVQYTQAKDKLDVGDYKAAREDFNQFLKTFPNSKLAQDAKYWLAESYYREGAYKKAIIGFEKMIRDNPTGGKIASALLKQAEAFKKLGDKESAGILYQKIIKKFPKTSQASNAKYELNRI